VQLGLCNDTVSVGPSISCLSHLALQPRRAADLLLWARRAGDIDDGVGRRAPSSIGATARRSAANVSSVTLIANVGG